MRKSVVPWGNLPSPEVIYVKGASVGLNTVSSTWDIKTPPIFNCLNKFLVLEYHASELLNFPVYMLFMFLGLITFFVIRFKARSVSAVPAMIDNSFVRGIVFVAIGAAFPIPPHLLPNEYVFKLIREGTIVHKLTKAEEEWRSRHWTFDRLSDFVYVLLDWLRFKRWVTIFPPALSRNGDHDDKCTLVNGVLGVWIIWVE